METADTEWRIDAQDLGDHLGALHLVHHAAKLIFLAPQGPPGTQVQQLVENGEKLGVHGGQCW